MAVFSSILLSILLVGSVSAPVFAAGPPTIGRTDAQAHDAAGQAPRWQQRATLTARDGVAGDHLGGPVALSGDTALVGAWDKNRGAGAAYVFVQHGRTWTEQARLTTGDGRPGDWFGVSVALSGNTALVGAPLAGHTGAAYVFVRDGGHWTQQAKLTAGDAVAGDYFGTAVALGERTGIVGAGFKNHATGAAYVFSELPVA